MQELGVSVHIQEEHMAHSKKDKKFQLFTPNGTMEESLSDIVIRSGLPFIREDKRRVDDEVIGSNHFSQINFIRPHDIPEMISRKKWYVGLTGLDMLVEFFCKKNLPWDEFCISGVLNISGKSDMKAADIVLASRKGLAFDPDIIRGKQDKDIKIKGLANGIIDRPGVVVLAEYPSIARRIFKHAEVFFSHGSTEQLLRLGFGNYGVFLRDQGGSIRSNKLVVVKELFSTPMVLFTQKENKIIKNLGARLMGVLFARQNTMLYMHAPQKNTNDICKILPSMRFPTITKLPVRSYKKDDHSEKLCSLMTTVKKTDISELQLGLKDLGATDFVEVNPEVIVRSLESLDVDIRDLFPVLLFPELQQSGNLKM